VTTILEQTPTTGGPTTDPTTTATTAPAPPAAGTADTGGSDGVSTGLVLLIVLLVAAVAAVVGAAIGIVAGRRRATPPAPPPPPPPPPPADPIARDRTALAEAIIDARDRLGPGALSERLGAALATVGVETLDPVGEPFDANRHWAQGSDRLTPDPALDGTVAETVTFGYVDRGRPLRLPGVVVYRKAAP
jgi:hypothetical protein